jgi:hypothetical protein
MNLAYKDTQNFTDKKVSTKQAVTILAKNGIKVNEDEATVILNFLYLVAKLHCKPNNRSFRDDPLEEIEPYITP